MTTRVKIQCRSCGAKIKAPTREKEYRTKCPRCSEVLRIPATSGGMAAQPAPPSGPQDSTSEAADGDFDQSIFFAENLPSLEQSQEEDQEAPPEDHEVFDAILEPEPVEDGDDLFPSSPTDPTLVGGGGNGDDSWLHSDRGSSDAPGSADLPSPDTADFAGAPAEQAAAKMESQDEEAPDEFRMKCTVCDSILWVRKSQVGKTIRCDDCHCKIVVPEPPKVKKKPKREVHSDDELPLLKDAEMPKATAGTAVQASHNFQQHTVSDYLREAEQAEIEEDLDRLYDDPDVGGWLKGVFGMFADPGVLLHLLIFGLGLSVFAAILLSRESVGALGILAAVFMGFIFMGLLVSGLAILVATANGHDYVADWPIQSPAEAMGELVLGVVSFVLAGTPGLILTTLFGFTWWLSSGTIVLSVYLLWPFILMSMLDNNSLTAPYSSDVVDSFRKCPEAWGTFYTATGILAVMLYVCFLIAGIFDETIAVASILCGFGLALIVFLYFRIMGQLALQIGEVLNNQLVPDTKSDEDEDEV